MFELIEAAPADRRIPVLDDVAHLLDPLALEARMAQVPAYHPGHAALAGRIQASASLARAEPELLMTASSQLAQLRQSPIGRWLRPAPASAGAAAAGPSTWAGSCGSGPWCCSRWGRRVTPAPPPGWPG